MDNSKFQVNGNLIRQQQQGGGGDTQGKRGGKKVSSDLTIPIPGIC